MRISDWSSDVCSSDLIDVASLDPHHAKVLLALAQHKCANASEAECRAFRSEEHTSELQSLMRISYAVFCLKKKKTQPITKHGSLNQQRDSVRYKTNNVTRTTT